MFKRFFFSITTLAIAAATALAAVPSQSAVDRFVNADALACATTGVCVMDLETGKIVAGHNVDKGIVTASTMKIVTTATALEILGKDFLFHTRVYAVGNIDEHGKLTGNIIIAGGGDPTLGSRFFKDRTAFVDTLMMRMQAAGIKSIEGDIQLDATAIPDQPVPGYWMLEDMPESYGTGYHAINFADNQMRVKFTYHKDGSYTLSTIQDMPWLDLRGNVHQQIPGDTMNRPGLTSMIDYRNNAFDVTGIVARRKRGRENFTTWYACPAPQRLLSDSIRRALNTNGIVLAATKNKINNNADTLLLLDYTSPSLAEIIESTLFRSDNMFAEALLRALPVDSGLPATTSNGVRMAYKLWKQQGLDTRQLAMKDGSGLARNGWATPQFLCDVLRLTYADSHQLGVDYSQLLPRAGREGSVKRMLRKTSLRGNISLKSGSMGGVQCYAGYYPARNPRYAVAVMVNNFSESRRDVVAQVQHLLINLF